MCSIGWMKLNESWILFKNRDRIVGESKDNIFIEDDIVAGFGDKKFPGLWIGINKYGIGITTAYGPTKEVPRGFNPENFETNERVLRESRSVEEAAKIYLEFAKKLGRSFIVIIADSKHAITLEIIPRDYSKNGFCKFVARTNYFTKLKKYNTDKERTERSKARLRKLNRLLQKAKNEKDLINILGAHSSNDYENICRHDKNETVASVIFEIKKSQIKAYYSLNRFPHEKLFEKKTISFEQS